MPKLTQKAAAATAARLLNEAADELSWMHRAYMSRAPLSEGVPRVTRLLQKIEDLTGHAAVSPYPAVSTPVAAPKVRCVVTATGDIQPCGVVLKYCPFCGAPLSDHPEE